MSRRSRRWALASLGAAVMAAAVVWQVHRTTGDEVGEGPVLHWVLDGAQVRVGKVPDQTGRLAARVVGEPVFITEPTPAVEFRSETDGIVVDPQVKSDAAFLPREALGVAVWVRIDRGARLGGLVSMFQSHHDTERGFLLGYTNDRFRFGLSCAGHDANAPMTVLTSKARFERGKWYHVAGSYDGQTMHLYINGRLENSSTEAFGPVRYPGAAPFLLGRYRTMYEDYPLQGALRSAAVYRRALTAKEVAAQFEAEKQLAALPPASSPHLVVAPYLQHPTRDAVTVMWESSVPGASTVEYDTRTPPKEKVELDKPATIHEVRLTNLQPNTKYYYRVRTTLPDGRVLRSEIRTFQTAVDADSAFSFVAFGDTQKNPEMTGRIARLAWERRPHFAIHLGDVVDNGPDKREWVDELFRPCMDLFGRVPVFPTIGNHEKDHAWYYRYFSLPAPEYYYRYRYGNADFFVLDSNRSLKPGSEQYQWLDRELSRSDARWKFAYHHHPAYSSDDDDFGKTWVESSTMGDPNVRPLVALYEKHNVDIVFNGHIHSYERTWPVREGKVQRDRGVIYVTSGGGGGRLENHAPTPSWFKAQVRVDYHFCLINIHQGQLEFCAFDQRGRLFDTFTLRK